ncbi:cyclic nucleotide-binding domain-containing protein [Candidatus Gracilibacteria bacterium]|nr:cyclic nucleotide-binding domain-containing protein [Candidatus Gracilibacteria bacterium]
MSQNIESLYIFDGFSKEVIAFFLMMSQTQYRKKGEIVIQKGEVSNGCAYYINSGKVSVHNGSKEIAVLSEGGFFGEMALITDEPHNATIEVVEDAELQLFLKDDFLTLLQQSAHSAVMKEEIRRRIIENSKK